MKKIYACHCGSTNLWRDAAVAVNDGDQVTTYDSVSCSDCGYDGSYYYQIEVPDDFEIGSKLDDKSLLIKANQAFL